MIIRDATEKDTATISKLAQEIYASSFGHTMSHEELTEILKTRSKDYFYSALKRDTILVAEEENEVIGFIQFGAVTLESVTATDKNLELIKIYIDTNHQGQGVGKALMKAMFEHPRLDRIENIYLDVYTKNDKAIGLYKKYGFKIIGKIPYRVNGKIIDYDLLMQYSK